jgi:hypothetical protein
LTPVGGLLGGILFSKDPAAFGNARRIDFGGFWGTGGGVSSPNRTALAVTDGFKDDFEVFILEFGLLRPRLLRSCGRVAFLCWEEGALVFEIGFSTAFKKGLSLDLTLDVLLDC